MRVKKTYLILIAIFMFFFSCFEVYASDLKNLKIEQAKLTFLKDEDLSSLVLFSEYDIHYDRKLYYNSTVRKLISDLSVAEKHIEQSNVAVSYYEYRNTLKDMQKNDFYYMLTAYKLSDIGFFSLAHNTMMKVEDKEIWNVHSDFIRKHRFPTVKLKTPEEVFLAGILSDIIYNNLSEESIQKLEEEKKVTINNDYVNYIKAKAFYSEKKYKQALLYINDAIKQNQNNIIYKKFKAQILNASGNEKEAIKILNQVKKQNLVFVDVQKNFDKIKYNALSKIEKNPTKQKFYLAYYFYLNQDYQRAIKELNLLILKGENNKAPELLGNIYKILEKYDEAKTLYKKCLLKNEKAAFAHKGLGDLYLIEKKYSEALSEYLLANKYQKNNIETLVAITVIYQKLKDNKNTQKYLSKANNVNANHYKVLYLNSKIRQDKGKQYLKTSISKNPLFPAGWLDLAQDALELKDLTSAEEYINTAAFITKNDARYFYYKSILNTEKRDYKTANEDIKRAKEIILNKKEVFNEQL